MFLRTLLTLAAAQLTLAAAPPTIQNVLNGASFQPGIASAAWVAITGSNLSATTRGWAGGDFAGTNLPTQLDGVQVTINGIPAYVEFISPNQINVLAPDDPAIGQVTVQVVNAQGASLPVQVNKLPASPALFAYSPLGGKFPVVQEALDSGLIGPPSLLGPAVTTNTASPGETLILYATGLGPANPAQPTGKLVPAPAPLANPVTVTIGGKPAPIIFAGLTASGLYQLNISVPVLRSGDAQIVLTANGVSSPASVYLPVQAYGHPSGQSAPALANCVLGQVDYIAFSTARLSYGQADEASIGGSKICATCGIKPPLYPEFATRLARSIETGKNVQACYDANGQIFQLKLLRP